MALNDSTWELVDPNPNIVSLFQEYNDIFFQSRLGVVVVEWSKRMTSCAGICEYQTRSGFCVIRLSEPLLKFRSRGELIETLLHEMIHAYLFITEKKIDREGHGPDFIAHMNRINSITGLKISVYHTFHDEVRFYQKHEWRCNGVCQSKPPYYGILRRATNRAPGPNDFWWKQHQATCGGSFIKVAGDTSKPKKDTPLKVKPGGTKGDIRKYLDNKNPVPKGSVSTDSRSDSSLSVSSFATPTTDNMWWEDGSDELDRLPLENISNQTRGTLKISSVSTNVDKRSNSSVPPFDFTKQICYKLCSNVSNGPAELYLTSDLFFNPPVSIKMDFGNNESVEYKRAIKGIPIKIEGENTSSTNKANRSAFVNLCDDSD